MQSISGKIIVTGTNIRRNPAVSTGPSGGSDGQGTIRIQDGKQVFKIDDAVVFDVQNVMVDGSALDMMGRAVRDEPFALSAELDGDTPRPLARPAVRFRQAAVLWDYAGKT